MFKVLNGTVLLRIIPAPIDAGTEPFAFGVSKKIYINNYEIIVTAGTAAGGEGLLYLPLVKRRIPVEWQGLTVNESKDGTYGCVLPNGTVQMQGSQTGTIGNDLYRGVLALLTQGPGSFSGKFGDAADKMAQTAFEIKKLLNASQNVPDSKYSDLNKYTKATINGFSEWKTQMQAVFGTDLSVQLGNTIADKIAAIEQALQDAVACATAKNCTPEQLTAVIEAKDKINELKAELKRIQDNLLVETAPLAEVTTSTTQQPSEAFFKDETANFSTKTESASARSISASILAEDKTFTLNGGGRFTLKAGVNLEFASNGNWIINGEEVIFLSNKSSGAFKGIYKTSYLTSPPPAPCTLLEKIERSNKKYFNECQQGYVQPAGIYEVQFDKIITLAPNIASIDLSQLNSLYGEGGLKGKVFITNDNTPADFIQKVQNFVAPSGWAKIWLHKGADGWELKSESGGGILASTNTNLTSYNAKLKGPCYGTKNDISVGGLVKSLKNNDADNLLFGLHKGLDFLSSKINQAKIPEEYWNCTDPKYEATYAKVFTYVLAPLLAPISYFANDKLKELFGPNAGASEIVFAMQCGLYNGMISTVSGAVDAVSQITSLATCQGQESIWAKVEEARNYTNPPGCSAGTPGCETGMLAYAKDMGSQMATALSQSPCLVAEIGGEISFGVGLAFLTAGASATVSSNTYANFFFKGLNFMDKISETFDIGGKIFSAGLSIAGKATKFAYRGGKAFFKGITLGDLPNQRTLPGIDGHDYTVNSQSPLSSDHNVKPLLDDNGDLVLDESGAFGIGCAFPTPAAGQLYNPSNFLEETPVFYASLNPSPAFDIRHKTTIFAFPVAPTGGCPNGGTPVALSNAAEKAWLTALKAKLRGLNFTDAHLATFLDDFPDEATRRRFLNDDLDPAVWKRFNELTGPTKAWVRKSVALQERIKAKIADGTFTSTDVDKLKSYYSTMQLPDDRSLPAPPFNVNRTVDGVNYMVNYNTFGHADFDLAVANIPTNRFNADNLDGGIKNGVKSNDDYLRAAQYFVDNNPNASFPNGHKLGIIVDGKYYAMHHLPNGKGIVPVLADLHSITKHTEGASIIRNELQGFFD